MAEVARNVEVEPPIARPSRLGGAEIGNPDGHQAPRAKDAPDLTKVARGIREVLAHVPENDKVVGRVREGQATEVADADIQAKHVASVSRASLAHLRAGRLPALAAKLVEHQAVAAADLKDGRRATSVRACELARFARVDAIEEPVDGFDEASLGAVIAGGVVVLHLLHRRYWIGMGQPTLAATQDPKGIAGDVVARLK